MNTDTILSFMRLSRISFLLVPTLLFLVIISCDTEDPFSFEPPDLSTVPEPYDTSGVELIELEEGVQAYIHEEGSGPFTVNTISVVNIYLTLRTESGEILYSTFSDGATEAYPISVTNADGKNIVVQNPYGMLVTHTPGFKRGLLGMKDEGKRTLIVSPEKGFENIPRNSRNTQYLEETLIYDIHITQIGPAKSR